MAKQSTITVGKSGFALGQKRTDDEWDELFTSEILPALQAGTTMTELRSTYGRSECIRQAARRAGYASTSAARRGERNFTQLKVKGVNKKVLANRIAARRQDGASWNTLRLQTGLDRDELMALLKAHGHDGVTDGRVVVSERGKAAQAKAEAAAQAAKPKRTRRTRKATA